MPVGCATEHFTAASTRLVRLSQRTHTQPLGTKKLAKTRPSATSRLLAPPPGSGMPPPEVASPLPASGIFTGLKSLSEMPCHPCPP